MRSYFGVKIAMYFAYLGHYTLALSVPTFLGILLWCVKDFNQVTQSINTYQVLAYTVR